MLFCAVDFSTKKGRNTDPHSLFVRRATPEYPAFTLIISRTMERGDAYSSLYQKGRDTDTVLSQMQSLGLRIKSFNMSDLRKTLSSRNCQITSLQSENVVLLQKKGARHGPSDSGIHAMLSKLAAQDRN